MRAHLRILALLLMVALPASASAAETDKWQWIVAPYLWAPKVKVDLAIGDEPALGGEIDVKDLLDKVDAAFMGHFEARKGRWGFYLDTIYIDLSDETSQPVGPGGPILGDLSIDATMNMKLYDAGAAYRVSAPEAQVNIDLLAGIRYIDISLDADITLPGPAMTEIPVSTGPDATDLMLGARFIGDFNDRWYWTVRGDFSFGDSEGTYNGLAAIGYNFGKTDLFSMKFGYRYMRLELKGDTPGGKATDTEMTLSGPLLGFIFKF